MIQELINTAIAEGQHGVEIPPGTYQLDKGLVVGNKDGTFLESFVVEAKGRAYGEKSKVKIIAPADSFGIAFQRCKGYGLNGVYIEGQNKLYNYSPDQILFDETMDWQNGCDRYHAGILIDPFYKYSSWKPKGFEEWCENENRAGSTDGVIDSVSIRYFVDGFADQPTGMSANGDCIAINNSWIDYCKYAVSTGNHQNRSVFVNNLKSWGGVHTIFNTRYTGSGTGCPPESDGLDFAGCTRFLCNLHPFVNYNALTINRAHIEMLASLGGCDVPSGRLIIDKSLINFVPGRGVLFTGDELLVNGSMVSYYGSPYEVMRFDCRYADFNNTKLDDFPVMENKMVKGKLVVNGFNRQGVICGDDEKHFIDIDSNDAVNSYVIGQRNEAVIKSNYNGIRRIRFITGEGYYDNGYLRRFLPNICTGYTKTGSNVITNISLADEWRWRQFETGVQLVGTGFNPGTLIQSYNFADKTITISQPAKLTGTRNINGVEYKNA